MTTSQKLPMERDLSGAARLGIMRKGRRVYITVEFPNEYDAMQAFDTWSMEDISFSFRGPKITQEIESNDNA